MVCGANLCHKLSVTFEPYGITVVHVYKLCLQLRREFAHITRDDAISNASKEWSKWEEKLLLYGSVEARSSKALEKKLSGKYMYCGK